MPRCIKQSDKHFTSVREPRTNALTEVVSAGCGGFGGVFEGVGEKKNDCKLIRVIVYFNR